MNNVFLSHDPLDINGIYSSVADPECGAVSLFVGTTRNSFEGKHVVQLEYEAYESMAIKSLEALTVDIRSKYPVTNIAIHHRLGVVPVLDASVVIAISSTHRQASLDAVSYAIDTLKGSVPIFKKEVYSDDAPSQWKNNQECISSDAIKDINFSKEIQLEPLDNDLVQITANNKEIDRRIKSFMKRKREESDRINLQDFCFHGAPIVEKEFSCARIDAVLIRSKHSKSHLKVCRVENTTGPQIEEQVEKSTQQPSEVFHSGVPCPIGAEERLWNAENFVGSKCDSLDVFARLKAVEDRLLYLEGISPEYFEKRQTQNEVSSTENRKIPMNLLRQKVVLLESKFQSQCSS